VKVPGVSGQFEILKGHAAIVSSLNQGTVRIIDESNQTKTFTIDKGFVEVLRDEVSLLVTGVTE
jgi:F-type H+-transporting ATPase subunit epsilon